MIKIMFFILVLFTIINMKILKMTHPLLITIMLTIQTSLIMTMMGLISQTFWMSYIMFLIFIGGLLILFIYISSLTSNKILNFKKKNYMIIIPIVMFFFITPYSNNTINLETSNLLNLFIMINKENNLFMSNFYNWNEMYLTMLMMTYLMLVLIIMIKITNLKHNPMRIKS